MTLHYTPNANFDANNHYAPGDYGFNLADVSALSQLALLPNGVKALVFIGITDGVTPAFTAFVTPFLNDPRVWGFYIADEPDPNIVTAANLKAESDWIHANTTVGSKTLIVLSNQGTVYAPSYAFTPANTGIDYFGLDPYPIRPQFEAGFDYSVITAGVAEAINVGIPQNQIIPVFQGFGGGGFPSWTMPTPEQARTLISVWSSVVPNPVIDIVYSYGVQSSDNALITTPDILAIYQEHNNGRTWPLQTVRWNLTNQGKVSAPSGTALLMANPSDVTNSGTLSGQQAVIQYPGGSFTNSGHIVATAARGSGVRVGPGVYIGRDVGAVTNSGIISANAYGVVLNAGGTVTNSGSITGGEDGVIFHGTPASLTNSSAGSIIGTLDDGMAMFNGGSIFNQGFISGPNNGTAGSGGFVTGAGGYLNNSGTITDSHIAFLVSTTDGNIVNSGVISGGTVAGVFVSGGLGTLVNTGTVSASGAAAVDFENGGTVTNTAGLISAHNQGVFMTGASGVVSNAATITSSKYAGVVLAHGGSVTNTGSIAGGSGGVYFGAIGSGTMTNSGTITGASVGSAAINLANGGTMSNHGVATAEGFGAFAAGASTTIGNYGTLSGTQHGVGIRAGGQLTNHVAALTTGGVAGALSSYAAVTIVNYGILSSTVSGAGADVEFGGTIQNKTGGVISGIDHGVFVTGGIGTVTNNGSISGNHGISLNNFASTVTNNATVAGVAAGISSQGSPVTIVNYGSITGSAALDIEDGGVITNKSGASIAGSSFGIFIANNAATVTNAGVISGGGYSITFPALAGNVLVVQPTGTFGSEVLCNAGVGTTHRLELAAGTGTITGVGSGSFRNFDTLLVDVSGNWLMTGANTITNVVNNGTLTVAHGSTLTDSSETGNPVIRL